MTFIRFLYHKWDNYFFGPILPYPLAAFRILFGAYLILYFLNYVTIVPLVFSNEGIYVPFLIADIAPTPLVANLIYGFTLLLIIAFMVGFYTRLITPLLLLAFLYHYFLSIAVHATTYDGLIAILLFILSLTTLDKVWSVTSFWSPSKDQEDPYIVGWANRFLCLYVSIFYLGMVAYKLTDLDWYSGITLEMNFHGMWATPLAYWVLHQNPPLAFFTFLTYATMGIEFLCSFGLYNRRIQNYVFLLGFLMHFMIAIFLNIGEFMVTPMLYILFVDPIKVRRMGEYFWQIL